MDQAWEGGLDLADTVTPRHALPPRSDWPSPAQPSPFHSINWAYLFQQPSQCPPVHMGRSWSYHWHQSCLHCWQALDFTFPTLWLCKHSACASFQQDWSVSGSQIPQVHSREIVTCRMGFHDLRRSFSIQQLQDKQGTVRIEADPMNMEKQCMMFHHLFQLSNYASTVSAQLWVQAYTIFALKKPRRVIGK